MAALEEKISTLEQDIEASARRLREAESAHGGEGRAGGRAGRKNGTVDVSGGAGGEDRGAGKG